MIDIKEMDIAMNGEVLFEKVSLSLSSGSFIVITGESGIGKSTFLENIYSLNHRHNGTVFYEGLPIEEMTEQEKVSIRRKMGIVGQQPYFFKYLNVKDNIGYRCEDLGWSKEQVKSKVEYIANFLGISEILNSLPEQISGGQLQRMTIAMEAINEPKYFFLDEPTSNLDTKNGLKVIDLCLELKKKGTTIVLVTHDQSVIDYLKSKEAIIYKIEDRKLVKTID